MSEYGISFKEVDKDWTFSQLSLFMKKRNERIDETASTRRKAQSVVAKKEVPYSNWLVNRGVIH